MAFRFSSPIGRATGASALLHATGLAAILLPIGRTAPEPAPSGATIELRLVETQGSVQTLQPEPLDPSPNPFSLREGRGERGQIPLEPSLPPQLNLAGDSMANALASGPAVVPARVDARWHNHEPVYPPGAARRREAGTVLLVVHVGPDGAAMNVGVAESSGFPQLDVAARTAVETWHFLPAARAGQPVASDMPLRVVFQLN